MWEEELDWGKNSKQKRAKTWSGQFSGYSDCKDATIDLMTGKHALEKKNKGVAHQPFNPSLEGSLGPSSIRWGLFEEIMHVTHGSLQPSQGK